MPIPDNYVHWVHDCGLLPSKIFRSRWECFFYGRRGAEVKRWILESFGDSDDTVYTSSDLDGFGVTDGCGALITDEQLNLLILRWT